LIRFAADSGLLKQGRVTGVMTDKGRAKVWDILDEMHERMKDQNPRTIEKLIDEAVKEAKKQGITGEPTAIRRRDAGERGKT
jgi:hypothetical protein